MLSRCQALLVCALAFATTALAIAAGVAPLA